MKKTLCMLLALLMLLLAVGCTNTAQKPDGQTSASDTVGGTTAPQTDDGEKTPDTGDGTETTPTRTTVPTPDPIDALYPVGAQNYLSARFIRSVSSVLPVRSLVGDEAFFRYVEEVYAEIPAEEAAKTPDLYKAIQYFNIDKADFLTVLDFVNQSYGLALKPWMVDALYAEDTNTMLEKLANPYAFYHDGKVYTIYELGKLSYPDCLTLGISGQKMDKYVDVLVDGWVQFLYEDLYEPVAALAATLLKEDNFVATDFMDSYSRRFIVEVDNVISIHTLVGDEACDRYFEEIYSQMSSEEIQATPDLYKMLRYFDISKEDYLVALEESERIHGTKLESWMVDALYAEDMNTMLEKLANPHSLYHNGNVFSVREMSWMSLQTCMELGITADILDAYLDRLAALNITERDLIWPIEVLADSLGSEPTME